MSTPTQNTHPVPYKKARDVDIDYDNPVLSMDYLSEEKINQMVKNCPNVCKVFRQPLSSTRTQ
jgi:hypothetical protein